MRSSTVHSPNRTKKLSPVMRQYDEAKAAHPDAILFFRLGDFYEMFNDDAVVASKALNLALTSRNKNDPDEVPMAGVPYHAAAGYVAKLLALGHKVALCEQMGDPSKTKGIVPRQVVRVLTPGLVTDTEQLDARANHFLAAVDGKADGEGDSDAFGFALIDLSTGELFAASVIGSASLLAEVARAEPREVLCWGSAELHKLLGLSAPNAAIRTDESAMDDAEAALVLKEALGDEAVLDAERAHAKKALKAAARVLRFVKHCTPGMPIPVRRVAVYDPSGMLRIDETAQLHLELVTASDGSKKGTLLSVIDATVTPQGARELRRRLLSPLLDVGAIRRRLDEIEMFVTHARVRSDLRFILTSVSDLERLCVRAVLREASPRDLGVLRDGLAAAPHAIAAVASIPEPQALELFGLSNGGESLDTVSDVTQKLAAALIEKPPAIARDGAFVRDGYDKELDELRAIQKTGAQMMTELEQNLRTQTNAQSLRIRYTRVFGWYIEVTKSHLAKVPAAWRRKQTVAGGERYTNDELDQLADRIDHAEARALERETSIFEGLISLVASNAERIRALSRRLATWDVASSLADVAHRFDYCRPSVSQSDEIEIRNGRHPVVERFAAAGQFVPNDTILDLNGERLWLVTGPNMAGKSTLMRQVALIVLLAQMGSFVPAGSANIGIVDRILSRVGASDNVARGESTFMVEMRETAAILREATRRSLVILDEIGRGTSTYDGLAIAWAVAEHLADVVGCRAMFATHYHELTELAKTSQGVANYSVSAREHGDDVVFLHQLAKGPASRSYGTAVARLAGLPESVLSRARAILSTLESGAALPSGKHATLRGRSRSGQAQLDLFAPPPKPGIDAQPVLSTLRAVDIERLAPLDALALVVKLKAMAGSA